MGLSYNANNLWTASGLTDADTAASELWSTASDPRFPGALLPVRFDRRLVIYVIANTAVEWRTLQALLIAFAGQTFTDFSGAPTELDATNAFEGLVLEKAHHAAARLQPGPGAKMESWTFAALRRLRSRVAEAPDLAVARPEPTSRLIARMRDALNASDFTEAWKIQATLRDELRLDALNLLQLEMLILAEAGRWSDVRGHDQFETLCYSEPPPATASLLLTTLMNTDLSGVPAGELSGHATWFTLVLPLLRLIKIDTVDIARLRQIAKPGSGRTEARGVEELPSSDEERVQHATATLLATEASPRNGDPEADNEARRAIDALSSQAQTELLGRPHLRGLWSEIEDRSAARPLPRSWIDWISLLGNPDVPALEQAQQGQDTWALPDSDPAQAAVLADALLSIPDGLPGDRFCEALPFFAKWVQNDPEWPRSAYARVYIAALTRAALGSRRGERALRSAAALFEGALACGLDPAEYRETLDAAREIARMGLGPKTIDATLDLVDLASSMAVVEEEALSAFILGLLSEIERLHSKLSAGQLLIAGQIGVRFGWHRATADAAEAEDNAFERIRRLVIGLYTLTESAGRQAKGLLEAAAPGVKVILNHDHVGTAPLAALSRNADLLVIVAASAKHAATDFIREKRGGRPLVYSAGRGAASVIRAVEQWLASAT